LLYVVAMWIAGVTEGLMWRATEANGSLTYAFIDSLMAIKPLYIVRWLRRRADLGRHVW
jgi:cytochrome c oxidase cbb3-type subunit 1